MNVPDAAAAADVQGGAAPFEMRPCTFVPPHIHPTQDEYLYMREGKLDFVPPVTFLGDDEFPLRGGDVAVFLGHKAATFVYARRLHVISLFVFEAASVIIQVFWYKRTGKRVFRMAPIHHHFELKGWAEPKIIVRFWILSIILALLAISTLKIR